MISQAPASWALRAPFRFGIAMVALMFAFKIAAIPFILLVGGGDTTGPIIDAGVGLILLSFLLLPLETLVGQALPIWLFERLGVRAWWLLCLLSAAVFGLIHLHAGLGGFLIGLTTGVVLSYCWLAWRVKSFGAAFWRTTVVHIAHNAVAMPIFLLGQSLQ